MARAIEAPSPTGVLATDTANLQAAFDAAYLESRSVELDGGQYVIGPLVFGRPTTTSQPCGLSLRGQGPMLTKLTYRGPDDGVALLVSGNWSFELAGFTLVGQGKGRGTGIELSMVGNPGGGTRTHSGLFTLVEVGSFADGWRIGRGSTAASELLFNLCAANDCTRGQYMESFNTLNLLYNMLNLNGNDVGLSTNRAGQIAVNVGGGADNGLTFDLRTAGQHSIRDFRDESAYFGFFGSTTSWASVLLENCRVRGRQTDASGNVLPAVATGWGCELKIDGGQYNGPIRHGAESAQFGGLTMVNVAVNDSVPFRMARNSTWPMPYRVQGCKQTDHAGDNQQVFPDEQGTIINGVRVPSSPPAHPHADLAPAGHSHPPTPLPADISVSRLRIGGAVLSESGSRVRVDQSDGSFFFSVQTNRQQEVVPTCR